MKVAQITQLKRMSVLAIVAASVVSVSRIGAQGTKDAAADPVRVVNVTQRGAPPSGPSAVVVEHDQTLATHTIFRPADLGSSKHPVLVWGEGGCAKNGLTFPEFLSEIASYGFVIMADGPPGNGGGGPGAGAGGGGRGPGGPGGAGAPGAPGGRGPGAAAGGAPRGGPGGAAAPGGPGGRGPGAAAGGAPRGGPGGAAAAGGPGGRGPGAAAGGAPRGGPGGGAAGGAPSGMNADGKPLTDAIDWLEKQAADPKSRFYQKVDTKRVAAMGMSCGGLMSYNASADPRIATVGIWNSGLIQPDEKIFAGLHSSVIIITGGESDIAYANGKRDFETLPARVPVFYGSYPSVGHGGTYSEDNGGAFGVTAVAWLKWQLMNDNSAKARGMFVGSPCGLCTDAMWKTDSRSLK